MKNELYKSDPFSGGNVCVFLSSALDIIARAQLLCVVARFWTKDKQISCVHACFPICVAAYVGKVVHIGMRTTKKNPILICSIYLASVLLFADDDCRTKRKGLKTQRADISAVAAAYTGETVRKQRPETPRVLWITHFDVDE